MAQITDGTFTNWQDTQTVTATEYVRERELLRIANNDNDTRLSSLEESTTGVLLGTVQMSKITDDEGGVSINALTVSSNILQMILTKGKGLHTFYAVAGAINSPPGGTNTRGTAHMTSSENGYVVAIDTNGKMYTNFCANGTWVGWTEFSTAIQSGSNTNGTYIKFPDGTMICHYHIQPTDQALNSPYGSLFTGTRLWTFPAPFVGITPTVVCPQFNWGTGGGWGTVDGQTLTTATLRGLDVLSRATGTAVDISAQAIGRWK